MLNLSVQLNYPEQC